MDPKKPKGYDDCDACDCDSSCTSYCVCGCEPKCKCICGNDKNVLDAGLGIELDSILAFRRVNNLQLGSLIEVLNANSSVTVELPPARSQEKVTFELIGVEYREVLDYLGLKYSQ